MSRLIDTILVASLAGVPIASLSAPALSQGADQQGCGAAIDLGNSTFIDRELPRAEVQRAAQLRSGPDGSCEVTYHVPAGATVELLGCDDQWCLVSYGSESGYVPVAWLDTIPDLTPDLE